MSEDIRLNSGTIRQASSYKYLGHEIRKDSAGINLTPKN